MTSNRFKPYYPSKNIIERFEDLSRDAGVPNVFEQAESTLNQMEDRMYRLNLYQDWDIDLQDFLPDTEPAGGAALPPTPMPAAGVVQTSQMPAPGTMNQGLTAVENALLSDEEKQIRLRQRGLA